MEFISEEPTVTVDPTVVHYLLDQIAMLRIAILKHKVRRMMRGELSEIDEELYEQEEIIRLSCNPVVAVS